MHDSLLLLPSPRQLSQDGGFYLLSGSQLVQLNCGDPQALLFTARRFQLALQSHCQLSWEVADSATVPTGKVGLSLRMDPDFKIPPQGYELTILTQGVTVQGRDLAGVFYGICTLIQIVEQCGRNLLCLRITDWPDFPARGVMLDVSRNRVPTLETLFSLVDQLAGWKINQLQLYFEHAFAYEQHPEVWAGVSPITGQEVLELDLYCRERFIELVPNQQSFGHLGPWLNHSRYKHLAEVEDGFMTPHGYRQGSFSLSPTDPNSIEFLRGLYAELLPKFSSRMFNIGCDETWDLGQGRSKEICASQGKGRVYLNFLLQIYQEVRRFGRTPQFWGDIILEHPELIPELPKDMIALEWGYEANHPFDLHGARFAASGIPFYVCPGTSAWCSLSGRTDNAVENLASAAENGLKHGAIGYLNTDWGDYGHWQPWPVSYLGLMLGAAYSWAFNSNRALDIAQSLNWHAFRDSSCVMGKLAFDLGNVYRVLGIEPHNSSVLFWIMQLPLDQIRAYPGLSREGLQRALVGIEAASGILLQARIGRPDAEQILAEFRVTIRLLRHACWRGLLAFETDPLQASKLRGELEADFAGLLIEYRQVWLGRNRIGGLSDSMVRLEKLRADYVEDTKKAE
jgi:hypothetical protein